MTFSKIQERFTSITTLAHDHLTGTDTVIALLHERNIPVVEATENGLPENEFVHFMKMKHGAVDTGSDKRFYIHTHPHFYWRRKSEEIGRNVCAFIREENSFSGEYVDGEPPQIDCDKIGVLEGDLPKIEAAIEAYKQRTEATLDCEIVYDTPQNKIAKMCGVDSKTVSNWSKKGLLCVGQGREQLYSRILTAEWLEKNGKRNALESLNNSK